MFFNVDNFTDRMMVALTTLLVIATIQTTIQSVSIEATYLRKYYTRLIEIWIFSKSSSKSEIQWRSLFDQFYEIGLDTRQSTTAFCILPGNLLTFSYHRMFVWA